MTPRPVTTRAGSSERDKPRRGPAARRVLIWVGVVVAVIAVFFAIGYLIGRLLL